MYRLYGDARSGNCYKIQWLMNELALPFEWVSVDILQGESRTKAFLQKNPNGRIPLLELDDGRYLAESNAILCFLAADTPLLPDENYLQAQVLQWLFFEQYSHEPYIATSRFIMHYLNSPAERLDELRAKREPGYRALDIMEAELGIREFMIGDHFTIADISLYAYTHVAAEGGFSLDRYPKIRTWLKRAEARPAYLPMRAINET